MSVAHGRGRSRRSVLIVLGALASPGIPAAAPPRYPERAVMLVVPFAPGGIADLTARAVAEQLALALGQPFVVQNKVGAATRIANEFVARAQPDGYTLLHAAAPLAIGEALYPKLPYDIRKSFQPVVQTATAP